MDIDQRKAMILKAIVSLYSAEGEPIGSGLLSRHMENSLSSATLRNEMAALTKLGMLEQPHTSAGRVPSTAGYRYYIDNIVDMQGSLSEEDIILIDRLFTSMDHEPSKLAQSAAKALSDLISYPVVATTPRSEDTRIAHFEVMQVGKYNIAILAVTGSGLVRTRVAKLDEEVTENALAQLLLQLNRYLCFVTIQDVTNDLFTEIIDELGDLAMQLTPAINCAISLLREADKPVVFLEGQQYLFDYKEMESSMATIMSLFGNTQAIQKLISPVTDRTTVLLGGEIPQYQMNGVTIATKRYWAGSGLKGAIGIIGPDRMNYSEVIPKLEYFAQKLGQSMSEFK